MTDARKTRRLLMLILLALLGAGVSSWAGQANLFVYHRFGDGRFPSTNTSLADFEGHLETLRRERIPVLPLGEVVRRLRSGAPLPDRCAVLTVDDGYETFLTGAMPLLRRYGFPATLFVSTDFVGHSGYLNWKQLQELSAQGVEIGNHSHSHPYLVERVPGETEAAWRNRIRGDIVSAQTRFKDKLGLEPRLFSYPYGEYLPQVLALLRELGFVGAVVQHSGVVSGQSDPFLLPRFPMGGGYGTVKGFSSKLRMRPLPVAAIHSAGPVLGAENPPLLTLDISPSDADLSRMRCFVNGEDAADIRSIPGFPGRFEIRARRMLSSRRTSYVLTAPSRTGREWYWFSQLWIKTRGE
ncbi:MAG: polysaccharide deacetylase family protein [Deltaproteobacteria bacterium]|nr:polysaccharide deacetylase family protein [Deltaproteobacteria bacterium]